MEKQIRTRIISQDTEWEMIELKGKWTTLTWGSKDSAGNVEFCCDHENGTETIFYTQEELKQLISFLQKQIV